MALTLPAVETWTTPLAWCGAPLRPVENYSRYFPVSALFVRAELVAAFVEEIGPGMTRSTQKALPGLLRLDKGKAVEVHVNGLDGQCWTFRAERKGRKTKWPLHVGAEFPATGLASEELLAKYAFEQIAVQSVLPAEGSLKHISFIIRDDFSMEDLAHASDPDPND